MRVKTVEGIPLPTQTIETLPTTSKSFQASKHFPTFLQMQNLHFKIELTIQQHHPALLYKAIE